MKELIEKLLIKLGEDPNREGLLKTPERVEQSLKYLTGGYGRNVKEILNNAVFTVDYDEMVTVKDIEFYSLCEHHMLPFYGKIHISYVPDGRVIGLSKIPRIVEVFARRLQVQERMTTQIADAFSGALKPKGVAVVCEAVHMCMMMRGVEKTSSKATTSCVRGIFKSDPKTREELFNIIKISSL